MWPLSKVSLCKFCELVITNCVIMFRLLCLLVMLCEQVQVVDSFVVLLVTDSNFESNDIQIVAIVCHDCSLSPLSFLPSGPPMLLLLGAHIAGGDRTCTGTG